MDIWRVFAPPPTNWSLWVFEDAGMLTVTDHWRQSPGEPFPIAGTVHDTLAARFGAGVRAGKPALGVGEYYPRIWRRFWSPSPRATYDREWTLSVQAALNLLADMREVFRCIEPAVGSNSFAYGHQIRDLLMLACTEVESGWKSVLRANHYPSGRWNTQDYVKLLAPMRLGDWELALAMHPGFPPFKPFDGWTAAEPTKSLGWYDDYNEVKHGREDAFYRATLKSLVYAMGAVFVMVSAQFGPWLRPDDGEDEQHGSAFGPQWADDFSILARPQWLPEEYYIPPSFNPGGAWTMKTLWP